MKRMNFPGRQEQRRQQAKERQEAFDEKKKSVKELHEKGYTNVSISETLGIPESTVRNLV